MTGSPGAGLGRREFCLSCSAGWPTRDLTWSPPRPPAGRRPGRGARRAPPLAGPPSRSASTARDGSSRRRAGPPEEVRHVSSATSRSSSAGGRCRCGRTCGGRCWPTPAATCCTSSSSGRPAHPCRRPPGAAGLAARRRRRLGAARRGRRRPAGAHPLGGAPARRHPRPVRLGVAAAGAPRPSMIGACRTSPAPRGTTRSSRSSPPPSRPSCAAATARTASPACPRRPLTSPWCWWPATTTGRRSAAGRCAASGPTPPSSSGCTSSRPHAAAGSPARCWSGWRRRRPPRAGRPCAWRPARGNPRRCALHRRRLPPDRGLRARRARRPGLVAVLRADAGMSTRATTSWWSAAATTAWSPPPTSPGPAGRCWCSSGRDAGGAAVSQQAFPGVDARLSRTRTWSACCPTGSSRPRPGLDLRPARSPRTRRYARRPDRAAGGAREGAATAASFRALTGGDAEYAAWQRFYAQLAALAEAVAPTLHRAAAHARRTRAGCVDPGALDDCVERPLGDTVERRASPTTPCAAWC